MASTLTRERARCGSGAAYRHNVSSEDVDHRQVISTIARRAPGSWLWASDAGRIDPVTALIKARPHQA
jgi:hypothetical protein